MYYIHKTEGYSVLNGKEMPTWMSLENIMLSEISQTQNTVESIYAKYLELSDSETEIRIWLPGLQGLERRNGKLDLVVQSCRLEFPLWCSRSELTGNHEISGLIPGLTQWVKDLALP